MPCKHFCLGMFLALTMASSCKGEVGYEVPDAAGSDAAGPDADESVDVSNDVGGEPDTRNDAAGEEDAVAETDAPAEEEEPPVSYLFYDSFESGDMSATNEDGFRWAGNNRTSIVTAEAAVWNNGPRDNPISEGQDWTPFHGEHSLRFRYAALEAQSEQRFSLGGAYPEVWIRYWIRIPHNFIHENPTGSSANNKWFALWMDGYSQHGEGPTIVWNFWPESDGSSEFTFSFSQEAGGLRSHHGSYNHFIRYPDDQGRWMQVVLYAKMSTDGTSNDGETRIWRRWEGEEEFTLISESVERGFVAPENGPQGWAEGYIMGWSNSGYAEDTEFLLDEFTVSTTSLLNSR
jgi:hypothetical protein